MYQAKRFIRRLVHSRIFNAIRVMTSITVIILFVQAIMQQQSIYCAIDGIAVGMMISEALMWFFRRGDGDGPDHDNDTPDDKGPDGGISKMIRHQINEILESQEVK